MNVLYGTKFIDFQNEGIFRVRARQNDRDTEMQSRFLIGADGVFSRVRKQLYPESKAQTMMIEQEHWRAKGEFDEHFYAFLKGEITPAYAYLIPKDGRFLIGAGNRGVITAGYQRLYVDSLNGSPKNSLFSLCLLRERKRGRFLIIRYLAVTATPFSSEMWRASATLSLGRASGSASKAG